MKRWWAHISEAMDLLIDNLYKKSTFYLNPMTSSVLPKEFLIYPSHSISSNICTTVICSSGAQWNPSIMDTPGTSSSVLITGGVLISGVK